MKELQKLISELKDQKSKADKVVSDYWSNSDYQITFHRGSSWAFDLCIQKLNLLLAQQPNGEIAPPLQQAECKASLPSLEDAWNAGVNNGFTIYRNTEWGMDGQGETTFQEWYKAQLENKSPGQ